MPRVNAPNFLVCQNPLAAPGRLYLLRTGSPQYLFEVIESPENGPSVSVRGHSYGLLPLSGLDNLPEKQREKSLQLSLDWLKTYLIQHGNPQTPAQPA